MIQFSDLDLLNVVTEALTKEYYKYPIVQSQYQVEDLIQDCVAWFYEPMRSTKEQRLQHYINTYETKQHIENMIRFGCKQYIPALLRLNSMKYIPLSLNNSVDSTDDESIEFLDMIPSDEESIEMKLRVKQIIESLNKEQQRLLEDIKAGYNKTELREKYRNFDDMLIDIRDSVYIHYCESGESLNQGFGIKYSLSTKKLKQLALQNKTIAWSLFELTGNPKYFVQYKRSEDRLAQLA